MGQDDVFEENLVDAYQSVSRRPDAAPDKSRFDQVRDLLKATSRPDEFGACFLVVEKGKSPTWHSLQDAMTIGRRSDAGLSLPNSWVSSVHCRICQDGDDWYIKDAESKNGVLINGESKTLHYLREGDLVQIGAFLLVYVGAGESVELD